VLFVDGDGRRQTLCGVWRTAALRRRLGELPEHHGAALRHLLAGLRIEEIHDAAQPPPWYDCDSPDDLDRARRWS
jgi:molybdopterin-guanine dinucleotide biosynthesis protein A